MPVECSETDAAGDGAAGRRAAVDGPDVGELGVRIPVAAHDVQRLADLRPAVDARRRRVQRALADDDGLRGQLAGLVADPLGGDPQADRLAEVVGRQHVARARRALDRLAVEQPLVLEGRLGRPAPGDRRQRPADLRRPPDARADGLAERRRADGLRLGDRRADLHLQLLAGVGRVGRVGGGGRAGDRRPVEQPLWRAGRAGARPRCRRRGCPSISGVGRARPGTAAATVCGTDITDAER